tara:strand:+ start:299 stop:1105 length:807 start_codon:yes stop_codon:yes gene_type:complete
MHHSQLAKISSDWIKRFRYLESKLGLLYISHPEQMTDLDNECAEALARLNDHPLEVFLNSANEYQQIKTALDSKKVKSDNNLYSFIQTKHIDPDRGFELTTIRVIAGGLWLYCAPLDFGRKGIEVGALKKAEPTAKMVQAADTLLCEMKKTGFQVNKLASHELMEIANETAEPQLAVDKKIEAVIREVSLLGLRYLNLKGGQRSRFPNQCVERIFDILGEPVHPKKIQRIQKDYDSCQHTEIVLSDTINPPKQPLVFNTNSSKSLLSK